MLRARRPSIRTYLVALILGVALPLAGVLAYVFAQQVARESRESSELALRIADSVAADIASANVRAEALLARMASRPKVQLADPGDCDALFPVVDFFPQYLTLQLFDTSGHVVCSATPQPADAAAAEEAERWTTQFLRRRPLIPREPTLLPLDGNWVSIHLRPVTAHGLTTGTLALVQYIDFNIEAYPAGTVVTIVDGDGTIVARSSESEKWIGRKVTDAGITSVVLSHDRGRTQTTGVDGAMRQYGYTPVRGTRWHLYAGIPAGVATASVRTLVTRGTTAGLMVIAVVIVLGIRLSRTIEEPLDLLASAARRGEEIGYSGTVPPSGPREIDDVGHAFNAMVRNRAEAEDRLIESQRQLESLSRRLLEVQESERERIAREIHDELGQLLTAMKIDLGGIVSVLPETARGNEMITRMRSALDETLKSVRRIIAELRPPLLDDFGLIAAIEADVRKFESLTGIECELSVPERPLDLPPNVETVVYRILQEALTNVARHANATRVEIRLRLRDDHILLDVRDDGTGFDTNVVREGAGLGIVGMRERARQIGADLDIEGIAGHGTIVTVRVPVGVEAAS